MKFMFAKKSLGQNFLIDPNICRKIITSLEMAGDDFIFEIGPGRGALTSLIVDAGQRCVVLEKDFFLCLELKKRFPGLQVFCGDALLWDWQRLGRISRLKLLGNLPYNIASRLLWDIAAGADNLEQGVFMVQKEVAQRIVASPGTKAYGGLSVWVQSFFCPRILFTVPPQVFRPRPRVVSAVLKFIPLSPDKKNFSHQKLAKLIRIMFRNRRKQIGTILKMHLNEELNQFVKDNMMDLRLRPEDLCPKTFQMLSNQVFSSDFKI